MMIMPSESRRSRVAELAVYLPSTRVTSAETEARLAELNPGVELPHGFIELMTGVRSRHVAPPRSTAADLAASAAMKLLAHADLDVADIDLIIFAATSLNYMEPGTAHVVADRLGAGCPVFDVRNACNSVVNAIEVADSLIRTGAYHRVLVACGELVTPITEWKVDTVERMLAATASYSVSDAGAALLLEAGGEPGVLGSAFGANSGQWRSAIVPLRFSDPRGAYEIGSFQVDGQELLRAFQSADLSIVGKKIAELGLTMADFAAVCVHQPAQAPISWFRAALGIREDQIVPIVAEHGNVASAGLPLQLAKAVESGQVRRGDLVALVGLASGVSYGVVVLRW